MEILTPQVSVLLPVREWRDTTLQAIQSILTQTLVSLEILLIGQEDTGELADRLPEDPRLRLLSRQRPGIVGALNTGLAQARAPFIARMDDDDIAYPARLASQLDFLRGDSGSRMCGTCIRIIDRHGRTDTLGHGNRRYQQWLNGLTTDDEIRSSRYIECPLPHPTLMAHRDVWQRLAGYRETDHPEDYDLVLRAMLMGITLGKPEAVLQDWREHDDRLTHRDRRYSREAFARCRAWAAAQPLSGLGLAEGRSVWLCGAGRNARFWHDALTALGVAVQGFVDVHRNGPNRSKRGKAVIACQELPLARKDALVISTVTQPEARRQMLRFFDRQAWRDGRDFIVGG
ncbi:MAG: glycosyltransferase [Granulosicoccus sp.]|nr:glycosyltransferase [Granulosicoccus sp.]